MPRPPPSTDGRFRPPTAGRSTENLTMRTEKTYRPVMSGQIIWDPGPMRRQTTPRRHQPFRTAPTTVRCHTVARSLYRPGGNQTNQPVNRYIHSRHLPKPTPHTYPLSDAPPTQPIPITHQTRPQPNPYLSPIRHGPPIGPGHVRRSHTCTVTQSHARPTRPPHTPAPHTRPTHPPHTPAAPATQHARPLPHTHRTAQSSEHAAAPSPEQGAQSGGATERHRAQST